MTDQTALVQTRSAAMYGMLLHQRDRKQEEEKGEQRRHKLQLAKKGQSAVANMVRRTRYA